MFIKTKINRSTRGAAFAEYVILLGLVGIIAIFAVLNLGNTASYQFSTVQSSLEDQGLGSLEETPSNDSAEDGSDAVEETAEDASEEETAPPPPTPPNNEYYAVNDGFMMDWVSFDDEGEGEHDIVDMSGLVGSMYETINVEFFAPREFSISSSETGAVVNITNAEELILPANFSPYAMFELNTNGWESDPDFVMLTTP